MIVGASGTQTVYFQNLAPVLDNVPAATVTVNATPAANAINYIQGPGGGIFGAATTGLVTIDNQESFEFANKTTSSSTAWPAATRSTSTIRPRRPA